MRNTHDHQKQHKEGTQSDQENPPFRLVIQAGIFQAGCELECHDSTLPAPKTRQARKPRKCSTHEGLRDANDSIIARARHITLSTTVRKWRRTRQSIAYLYMPQSCCSIGQLSLVKDRSRTRLKFRPNTSPFASFVFLSSPFEPMEKETSRRDRSTRFVPLQAHSLGEEQQHTAFAFEKGKSVCSSLYTISWWKQQQQ